MNKSELIDAIAEKSGLTKTDAAKALDAFTSVVKDTLPFLRLVCLSSNQVKH